MSEDCVVCGGIDCIAELTKISTLDGFPEIEYLTHFIMCSECGTYHAGGIHLHLNKIEMMIALEKKKALTHRA